MALTKYIATFRTTLAKYIKGQYQSNSSHLNEIQYDFTDTRQLRLFNCRTFDISDFNPHEKYVTKDLKSLEKKLLGMAKDGISELQIVSDFDHTLTSSIYKGKASMASFGLFRESPYISAELKKEIISNYKYYYPIELDPHISQDDKLIHMREWVEKAIDGLIREKLSYELLGNILDATNIALRHKFDEFMKICCGQGIPFYVVSAGISNILATIINDHMDLNKYPQFHIYGNEMRFNIHSKLESFKFPVVHSCSKPHVLTKHHHYRKNVLLMGDIVEDTKMANNVKAHKQINIGFLNDIKKKNDNRILKHYLDNYDLVILQDGNLIIPLMMLKYISGQIPIQEVMSTIDQNLEPIPY